MEKPQRRVSEKHSVLVRRLDAFLVHDTSGRRSEIPNAALPCAMYVVPKREERIARTRHAVELPRMVRALLCAERRRDRLEEALPLCFLTALEHLASDEKVDRIRLVGTLDALLEREREDARVVAQPPIVRFGARESRAVDARLLAGAQSDYRAAVGIRYAVGLGVLQGQRRDDQVGDGSLGELCRDRKGSSMHRGENDRKGLTSLFLLTTLSNDLASILASFLLCCNDTP